MDSEEEEGVYNKEDEKDENSENMVFLKFCDSIYDSKYQVLQSHGHTVVKTLST